jgi:hypothetical protein
MVNLIDLISQKIELFRLEQRYTKRRNRRSTFVSDATYVDGEYIYSSSPSPTLSKRHSVVQFSSSSQESMSAEESGAVKDGRGEWGARGGRDERGMEWQVKEGAGADRGKNYGGSGSGSGRRGWNSARAFKGRSMVAVQEVR